ncbi:NAD P-binding protein [Mycena sanguinolenta]|uniref:NAD P-binding protein n=1 Tax=Mycena sanguinolenta TaxID=230812 RepID=A0A8H6XIQ2_9AGAR|nr:NAD P-binding protein [Mycena sanguinolenta]
MAPVRNGRVIFAKIPKDFPVPGETTVHDTTQTIDLEGVSLNGGFLVKTLVLSVDPYLRGRMRSPEEKSYAPPFTVGQPIVGYGIGIVLRSENSEVAVGKYVYGGIIPHQEYTIFPNLQGLTFLEKNPKLPWTVFVGAAGMPGPVGSMVVQLAKRDGLKVIASAGSDEKVEFMKQIGADVAFNYKTTNTRELLELEGPIDVYWDNVGGEILEAALDNANIHGRFINLNQLMAKSLLMSGILVFRLHHKYEKEFYEVIPAALTSGELKYSEDVSRGLETVGEVILGVLKGTNKGKAVVIVAEE